MSLSHLDIASHNFAALAFSMRLQFDRQSVWLRRPMTTGSKSPRGSIMLGPMSCYTFQVVVSSLLCLFFISQVPPGVIGPPTFLVALLNLELATPAMRVGRDIASGDTTPDAHLWSRELKILRRQGS